MNSIKTKSDTYARIGKICVGGIKIIPTEENALKVYVAWENEKAALNGFFSFSYKEVEVTRFNLVQLVEYVALYGHDMGDSTIPERYFPEMF